MERFWELGVFVCVVVFTCLLLFCLRDSGFSLFEQKWKQGKGVYAVTPSALVRWTSSSPKWTLNMKELCPRKQTCLAPTLPLRLFGDKNHEIAVLLQAALICLSDGINGLITPLLINEWEKCSQCQPAFSVSPDLQRVVHPGDGSEDHAQPHCSAEHLSVLAADPCLAPGCLHQEFVQYPHAGEARCSEMLGLNFWAVPEYFRDLWRPCAWLFQPPLLFSSSVGAGLHRSAVLAGTRHLPVFLLHGDWSCQVLIWSHP